MRIRNFIVADAVAGGEVGKVFIHGGGVTSIRAIEFPYVHPQLGLMLTLVYEGPEDDIEQHVTVTILDDAGEERATVIDLQAPVPEETFEQRESWQLLHVLGQVAGLRFTEPGRYWVVLRVNDAEIDRMVLNVELVAPPA